ncbi:kinase-like domain-containing protein [Glomus cerebriforme]|uniref:Kinase-like domain-containing protein n=1 Tax=Glomus cerebriforme TaxID=658196 RepID=A0A397SCK4_9GLOM|nr:kinase-like domain-containing protein [Glomus cerebriforme]
MAEDETEVKGIKCPECGQEPYTPDIQYCRPCSSEHFRDNFAHWTSGDSNIDKLIQNSQLDALFDEDFIEWIEYSNLENIEFVANGGFGSVYKAIWKDGPIIDNIYPWNIDKSEWIRDNRKEVVIKKFLNATSVSLEFLSEIENNMKLSFAYCVKIYGLTRDPQSGEYAIVAEFRNGGNLREVIKKNHSILNWKLIIQMLADICVGLDFIHQESNYCHKDFHTGNILNKVYDEGYRFITPVISDFGLSCPANQSPEDKVLYGVLPFVAPEVLRGGEFTIAADIYGFGMLMSEIISGEAPFIGRDYDLYLALDICKGERPQIPEYTPEPYSTLMKRCWDPIPTNRPTARILLKLFSDLNSIMKISSDKPFELWSRFEDLNDIMSGSLDDKENDPLAIKQEIEKVFNQEREDKWKVQLAELTTNPHPLKKSQNLLTSKRLDYSKHLTRQFETNDDDAYHPKTPKETNEIFYKLTEELEELQI